MTSTPHTDVVCLGESMVTFLPSRPGRLADVPAFERGIGGAESNVACALARTGHGVRWLSRVGTDGFGEHLLRTIAAHGVDVDAVGRDPQRPTGIYFRTEGERATTRTGAAGAAGPSGAAGASGADSEAGADADAGAGAGADAGADGEAGADAGARAESEQLAEVAYYRAGSAASAMSPETVALDAADSGRVLHLSGITAALSGDCLALMRRLVAPRPGRPLVSFDVNYRVGLWQHIPEGSEVLLELARAADLVFVGEDEAEAAWGVTGGAHAVRAALPEPAVLVVKDGSTGATAFARRGEGDDGHGADEAVFVPALRVDVATPVGAGDAFAAGFLSGTLRGLPPATRLRHGHLTAAAALTEPGDLAEPPARAHADRLAALDDDAWAALRLGHGWTRAAGATGRAGGRSGPATGDTVRPGDSGAAGVPGATGETARKASAP